VVTLLETPPVRESGPPQPLHEENYAAATPASQLSSHVVQAARSTTGAEESQQGDTVYADDELFGRTNVAGHPATLLNCESVLKWPIFGVTAQLPQSFTLEHARTASTTTESLHSTQFGNRGIQENDFGALTNRFLALVHIKNPVLDLDEYREWVKIAVDQGPGWDGPTCLVVSRSTYCMSA
jgi:hypothetical protein